MSDTPRTDAAEWRTNFANLRVVHAKFARELERELAAAQAQLVGRADELAAMQKQRDEARRWWCRQIAYQRNDRGEDFNPKAVAVEQGWDCFAQKEGGGA